LGYAWADNLHHLSYGLVFLPEGKMKSREGKVVDADDSVAEVTLLAAEEVKKRFPELADAEVDERSRMIGLGALKFFLLRVTPTQSIHFNPKEAISFEGSTGPYVQYAHARIASILAEETPLGVQHIDFGLLDKPEEKALCRALLQYPDMLCTAAEHYNPSAVCTYLIELAHLFNAFYHNRSVLKAETEELKHARLALVQAVQIVLRSGLWVLGIEAPNKM
ncbi:MAG: DALR anticodon-binding domain-containing protein, partial [bacterium]|nr:DALR anticodon-binding domain-containing protein [bacterium]